METSVSDEFGGAANFPRAIIFTDLSSPSSHGLLQNTTGYAAPSSMPLPTAIYLFGPISTQKGQRRLSAYGNELSNRYENRSLKSVAVPETTMKKKARLD